jgi:enolase
MEVINIMEDYRIQNVQARQVFDSRGNPTVEVDVTLQNGIIGRGIVPAGASKGIFEAVELRDGGDSLSGKGVKQAVANVNGVIARELIGQDVRKQEAIDSLLCSLDGTANKSRLGANAILGCSIASCWASANYCKQPLYRYLGGTEAHTIPVPMIQIIGGGAHAKDTTDIQDYLVIPMASASFAESYTMVVNVYNAAKKIFSKAGRPLSVADEGGIWPTGFVSNEEGLRLLCESIESAGYKPGKDLAIALDVAASEFYDNEEETYRLKLEKKILTSRELADMLCDWVDKYPIISIEDGMSELDWDGFHFLTERLSSRVQLIGDDLFTTNIERIKKGIEIGVGNAVLIKMNQIGTISETLEAIRYTQAHNYLPVISARSGETEDVTIVHLAIATNAGQLKVGSVTRSERTAKWNEVIRIEESLGTSSIYPSAQIFNSIGVSISSD